MRRIQRHDVQQRIPYRRPNPRLRDRNGQPKDPGDINTGADIYPTGKLITINKPNARQQSNTGGSQPRPGRANAVPALRDPHR